MRILIGSKVLVDQMEFLGSGGFEHEKTGFERRMWFMGAHCNEDQSLYYV